MRAAMLVTLFVIASCARDDVERGDAIDAAESIDVAETDAWLGDWRGPEGTLLTLEGGQGAYRVTVRDLDGPRSFEGNAVANGITFTRDGVQETITATDGEGTGMKWLVDKRDCLVIRPSEGFCRD